MPGTPFDALFAQYSLKTGVPQAIIEATARTESSLNPLSVVSEKNGHHSYGLFNMYDDTAKRYGVQNFEMLLEPEYATDKITQLMRDIIKRQGGVDRLNLNDFYSEFNSGKKSLWQQSSEVFDHVQNFLANYARSVTPSDAGALFGLVIALALVVRYLRKK